MRMVFKRKNPKNILPMSIIDVGIHQSPVSSFVQTQLAPAIAKQGKDRKSGSAGMPRSTLFPYTTLFRSNPKNILPMSIIDVGIHQSPVSSFVQTQLAPAIAKQGKVSFPFRSSLSRFPFSLLLQAVC